MEEAIRSQNLNFTLRTMPVGCEAKPQAFHLSTVMPAEVSGHPVFGFEILDSRVQGAVGTRLDLWRENDGTNVEGPHLCSPVLTNADGVRKIQSRFLQIMA